MNAPATPSRKLLLAEGFGCALLAGYFITLHALIVDAGTPRLTVVVVLLPWAVAVLSLCAKRVGAMPLALIAALVATIVWWASTLLARHVDGTLLVENLAFHAGLAGVFAATLLPGHEPLITRLARAAHRGNLPDSAVPYTRRLTAVWSAFFVAMATVSVILFFTVSREAWSVFVNLLTWPLVGAMFAIEYVVRRRVLPDMDHVSLSTTVRAYAAHGQRGDPR